MAVPSPAAALHRHREDSESPQITISDDGTSTDLGYPSTVELDDGSLLTVWYEVMGAATPETDRTTSPVERRLEMASRPDRAVLRQAL